MTRLGLVSIGQITRAEDKPSLLSRARLYISLLRLAWLRALRLAGWLRLAWHQIARWSAQVLQTKHVNVYDRLIYANLSRIYIRILNLCLYAVDTRSN